MSAPSAAPRDVSVVCPTFQEGASIATFLRRVRSAAAGFGSVRLNELIFVDDGSTDGTLDTLREAERTWTSPRVILLVRARKAGTVSAQVLGIQRSTSPIVVTMDADGQHPPETIARLVEAWEPGIDLVVASRYVPGGHVEWEFAHRAVISAGARMISRIALPGARRLRDPLSGFFLVQKDLVADPPPATPGYKILLYVLAVHPRATIREIPYEMGVRIAGESKLVRGVGFIPSFLNEVGRDRRLARSTRSRTGSAADPR